MSERRPSPFTRFYREFLENRVKGEIYELILQDGRFVRGVPTCGSFVNPRDPDAAFSIQPEGGGKVMSVPFRALISARRSET